MNFILNPLEVEDDMANIVAFIALVSLKSSHLDIYSTLFLQPKKPYNTRDDDKIPHFKVKHNHFKKLFFLSTVIEWNKLNLNIPNFGSFTSFKGSILKFACPSKMGLFFVIM